MKRYRYVDEPIPPETWDRIGELNPPQKVAQLVSMLQAKEGGPLPTVEIPWDRSWSVVQQANAIFLRANLEYRIAATARRKNIPNWQEQKVKIYRVETIEKDSHWDRIAKVPWSGEMKAIASLLAKTKRPISAREICEIVGIGDRDNFVSIFHNTELTQRFNHVFIGLGWPYRFVATSRLKRDDDPRDQCFIFKVVDE